MDVMSVLSPGSNLKHTPPRKVGGGNCNDIWAAVRNGSVQDVELALASMKKCNGNVDIRSVFGSTALHIAVWRNHIPIVRRLLAAGADPDARDGESGWSSLHRAFHFGHLAVAGVLLQAGASLTVEDTKGRIPIDLISGPVKSVISNSVMTEVYSWGNGANYQLGTGTAGIQRIPCRLDTLQNLDITSVAAAKFHSAAVTANGDMYTWGFGRGGRLGHPDFDIHSGQVAVIFPRQVTSGLAGKKVKSIAVAKHHSVISTDGGEVYTWGSNRDGRLGYPSVDTQPTPRKVGTLKVRVSSVAAANKHSAVLTQCGDIYTWGCNSEGQLGYGTSNSASNCMPRLIEYLKGRKLVTISTAKYHTVVLEESKREDGEFEHKVLTWGYKMVTPRRVIIARDTKKRGSCPLKFHKKGRRDQVVAIAAGMTHSTIVAEDGLIFYWASADPNLRTHQLSSMACHQVVAVAAGKYRTAVTTSTGNVYVWDGEGSKAKVHPSPVRVPGAKHITGLSVGETHSLAVAALYAPTYSTKPLNEVLGDCKTIAEGEESGGEDPEIEEESRILGPVVSKSVDEEVPSLKDLCQKVVIESIVEPKNALQILEFADSMGADHLRRYCEDLVLRNLDYILTISPSIFAQLPPSLLAELEKALDSSSGESWSHRLLPTPSATLPVVIDSEEEDGDVGDLRTRNFRVGSVEQDILVENTSNEGFLTSRNAGGEDVVGKYIRAVRKKLQQIESLELKQFKGHDLDSQQLAKLQSKHELEISLSLLESGVIPPLLAVPKANSNSIEKEMKGSPGHTENTSASKSGGRTWRKKGKVKGGHEQSVYRPTFAKSTDANSVETLDLRESLEQVAVLETTGEPSSSSPFVPSISQNELQVSVSTSPPSLSFKEISGFSPADLSASSDSWKTSQSSKTASVKKKSKKGGLSMFLSGELEALPKALPPTPPPKPKVDGPAWGGVNLLKGSASLREIQNQESVKAIQLKGTIVCPTESGSSTKLNLVGHVSTNEKSSPGISLKETGMKKYNSLGKSPVLRNPILEMDEATSSKSRNLQPALSFVKTNSVGSNSSRVNLGRGEISSEPPFDEIDRGALRLTLSDFVRGSASIAVTSSKQSQSLHPENSPPAWAGRSPGTSAPLLRDIQNQQVKQHKAQHRPIASRSSPQLTSPLGLMVSASGSISQVPDHGSPSSEAPSRWYKPEIINPSPIRNIQKEEEAMKDLRRLYKTVKIVRPVDN